MRRNYKKGTGIGIIAFVVLILFGIVTYKKVDLIQQQEQGNEQIANLESEIKEQEERASDIEKYEAYVQTPEYIKDMAREKLGLVDPDDILFVPED